MLVYICCAGGATSSLFCSKIKKASNKDNVLVDDLMTILTDFEELKSKYDYILAYGPAGFIRESSIGDYALDKIIDLILVCPQVRYLVPSIKKVTEPYNISCDSLDMKTFGTMNGEKALKDIIEFASK
ncbi:MAG: hypothetical protein E6248_10195 [Clostridium sp.]|uniref:PTS sugar transporter subunit IIB n=1 Tax=Clostridium sp. TaxID=1506 RepID=UPI00290A0E76|nr:hypothetical protein [Clostridium sp.]MDU5110809.1 hypothetical protein [Clostridium sp.]